MLEEALDKAQAVTDEEDHVLHAKKNSENVNSRTGGPAVPCSVGTMLWPSSR